MKWNIEVTVRL